MNPAERTLRDQLDQDAGALSAVIARRWQVAADPLGAPMLLPVGPDGDPLPVDELPWAQVIGDFEHEHGRRPRPGARAVAQRRLAPARRGGSHV